MTAAQLVGLLWAESSNGVIGRDGDLPWHLPEDLAHFKRTTNGHPVVMGRKTWESFPEKYRPLPGRTNIVISRRPELRGALEAAGAVGAESLEQAMAAARTSAGSDEIWIIGGGEIFRDATALADTAVVTVIDMETDGDTYAPQLGPEWTAEQREPAEGWLTSANGTRYRIERWTKGSS
ncbi:dihydrofolate reductase [Arthrobacter crystallopoietes BAB-32]|uniref:Dihydrofolate reductase n=1 Tax=Arthrobacter crystallopoietes BAB-32 TaxID=1246476 RepID=N1UX83_9MICC|nr:dihydrofolate reductase [Arthrobacter crystallopoietes]EMY33665.1 dihydrofolate reductase [Arthrobacter crystallopoietes BAB-32]